MIRVAQKLIRFAVIAVSVLPVVVCADDSTYAASDWRLGQSMSQLSRSGQHLEVLARAENGVGALTLADRLAVARSAWALGLPEKARAYWEEVLADPEFVGPERTRTLLSSAIMELQEQNYEKARAIAERTAQSTDLADVRGQFWLVIGEALREQGAFSNAEGYYKKAIVDGEKDVRIEATFLLAKCQMELGMISEARKSFASVETNSPYAAQAVMKLAEIDLMQRNYDGVITWVKEGREAYTNDFEEPWVYYAEITALIETGKLELAKEALDRFSTRYSPQEKWVALASAAVESKLVQSVYPRARLKE